MGGRGPYLARSLTVYTSRYTPDAAMAAELQTRSRALTFSGFLFSLSLETDPPGTKRAFTRGDGVRHPLRETHSVCVCMYVHAIEGLHFADI